MAAEQVDPIATPGAAPSPQTPPISNSADISHGSAEAAVASSAAAPPAATEVAAPAAPAVEAEGKPAAPATESEPTLLEKWDADHKPPVEAKPEGEAAKPAAEAKPGEPAKDGAAPEAVVEPVKVDFFAGDNALKLPDVIQMGDAERGEFNDALAAAIAEPGKGGQALLDLAAKGFSAYAEQLRTEQWSTFNDTRKGWRDRVMADGILGGNRYETAMGLVAEARDELVSDAERDTPRYKAERQEYEDMVRATGVGDHPAFLRLLHNAHKYVGEPKTPTITEIKPAPNNGGKPGSRRERLYPNTNLTP